MSYDHDIPSVILDVIARETGGGTTSADIRAFLNEKPPWAVQQIMRQVVEIYDLGITDEQIWKMIEETEGGR